jgi:hypothetical protein
MTESDISTMPYKVALILDGKVEEVFHCSQELAAKLLSSPTFHEVPEGTEINTGFNFDGNTFSA